MQLSDVFPVNPKWERVTFRSSLLKEGAWDPEKNELYIMFQNNSVYIYSPVEYSKFNAMKDSPSSGAYFTKNIKNNKAIKYRKYE